MYNIALQKEMLRMFLSQKEKQSAAEGSDTVIKLLCGVLQVFLERPNKSPVILGYVARTIKMKNTYRILIECSEKDTSSEPSV